jgi:hypothetical protein
VRRNSGMRTHHERFRIDGILLLTTRS